MRFGQQLSAKQMALLSGLGGLVAAGSFLLPSPRHMTTHPHYPFWLWVVLTFGLLTVGLGISLVAGSDLQSGIQSERWKPDEVVSLRAVLGASWWMVAAVTCIIGSLITMFAFPKYRDVGWALLIAAQSIQRLVMSARQPRTSVPAGMVWQGLSSIRSEHWGER